MRASRSAAAASPTSRTGTRRDAGSTACCSTWACRRRNSMSPSAVSASARTVRSTCAWIRTAAKARRNGWRAPTSARSPTCCGPTAKNACRRRIARAIVARRGEQPITRTAQLAELIASAVPRGDARRSTRRRAASRRSASSSTANWPTSRLGLDAAYARLSAGGRLAVISFHSLEDRIVKRFIAARAKAPAGNRRMPVAQAFTPTLRAIGDAQQGRCRRTRASIRARAARCCAWPRNCLREARVSGARAAGAAGRRQRAVGDRRGVCAPRTPRSCSSRLTRLEKARDELNIEFGRLQLEQATWAESNRIDQVARERAGHEVPRSRRHRRGAPMIGARHVQARQAAQPRPVQPARAPAAGGRHARPVFAGAGRARGRPADRRQRFLPRAGRRAFPARDRRSRHRAA